MSTVYIYIAQQLLHLCLQLLRGTNVIAHCHSQFLDDFCTCFWFIACFTWPMVKMAHDCDRFLSLTGQRAFCKNCRLFAFSPLKCLPEGSSWSTRYILGVCCLSGRLISDGFVVCCVICCFALSHLHLHQWTTQTIHWKKRLKKTKTDYLRLFLRICNNRNTWTSCGLSDFSGCFANVLHNIYVINYTWSEVLIYFLLFCLLILFPLI